MSMFIAMAFICPDSVKAVLILGFAVIILAGPLLYRILSGEKFTCFRDPGSKRPDKKQWHQLRNKVDQIIKGREEIDANELYELIATMQIEVEYYKRNKGTIEYQNDHERIRELYKKVQGMDVRAEPFDSLVEHLKGDGLIEQAQRLHTMVHGPSNRSLPQLKNYFLDELAKIRRESWNILGPDTKAVWEQSVKSLKHNPFTSLYVYAALIVIGLALRLYHSIVENKGYEFYRKHPIWIVVFAVIIGVPVLILVVKFVAWKYSMRENPYNLTTAKSSNIS